MHWLLTGFFFLLYPENPFKTFLPRLLKGKNNTNVREKKSTLVEEFRSLVTNNEGGRHEILKIKKNLQVDKPFFAVDQQQWITLKGT